MKSTLAQFEKIEKLWKFNQAPVPAFVHLVDDRPESLEGLVTFKDLPEGKEPAVDWELFERVVIPAFTRYSDEIPRVFSCWDKGVDLTHLKRSWKSWTLKSRTNYNSFYHYVLALKTFKVRDTSDAKEALAQFELIDRMQKEFPL